MPNDSPNHTLLQTITQMINTIVNEGTGYDTLINLLSLLCLLHILNRLQPGTTQPLTQSILPVSPGGAGGSTNPLQKILGELTKGSDASSAGPSPDMLMSLLPLLNNPQIKSKLNPANISSILGMVNNFAGGNNDKSEKKEPPAAAVTSALVENPVPVTEKKVEQETKDLGRSLNWKTHFQNEKEM